MKHRDTVTGKDENMKRMVITAFFAAITFLGIQAFRIPLPAVVGTPFVHFGHIFVDILNGFLQDVPQVFLETIIKCLLIGALFAALKKRAEGDRCKEYRDAMFCTVVYGCMNILIEFVMGIVKMMLLGSGFAAAAAGSAASIPATVINVVFLVIAVALLYRPVEKLYRRMCA